MESHKIKLSAETVRPGTLLTFAQEAALSHCRILGVEKLDGLFWAVIRHRVLINRMPEPGETVTLETWPMPTTRTAFPRMAVGYDEQGNELFSVISLWVLMDQNTRAMILPEKSGIQVPGLLKGSEPKAPGSVLPKPLDEAGSRQVSEADLDGNGHMNNARYLDWVWETLPEEWTGKQPREFTVCYLSEARLSQEMFLFWGQTTPQTLQFEGHRQNPEKADKKERVFAVSVSF